MKPPRRPIRESNAHKAEARSRGGSRLKQAQAIAMRKHHGSHQEPGMPKLSILEDPQLAAAENAHPKKNGR